MKHKTAIEYEIEINKLRSQLEEGEKAIAKLSECHDWQCGCSHWNGCNLSHCADCGRKPNER
jgi:hypothetical protein